VRRTYRWTMSSWVLSAHFKKTDLANVATPPWQPILLNTQPHAQLPDVVSSPRSWFFYWIYFFVIVCYTTSLLVLMLISRVAWPTLPASPTRTGVSSWPSAGSWATKSPGRKYPLWRTRAPPPRPSRSIDVDRRPRRAARPTVPISREWTPGDCVQRVKTMCCHDNNYIFNALVLAIDSPRLLKASQTIVETPMLSAGGACNCRSELRFCHKTFVRCSAQVCRDFWRKDWHRRALFSCNVQRV